MRARVESDLRLTSTTDARIEELVREAGWLRQQYGVPTGFQRAPFFEIQTDRFALIAVDTGVAQARRSRSRWPGCGRRSIARAASRPWRSSDIPSMPAATRRPHGYEEFAALKQLLLDHDVAIVMAGDTHDLEYYREPRPQGGSTHHS